MTANEEEDVDKIDELISSSAISGSPKRIRKFQQMKNKNLKQLTIVSS